MLVSWNKSSDPLRTATELSFQESFTLPGSFAPGQLGGEGDLVYTLNAESGIPNPAEIGIEASTFIHPDGNERAIQSNSDIFTPYGEGAVGDFYLMWSDTPRVTRFPSGFWGPSTNIIPIRWTGSAWVAFENNGTNHSMTIVPTDAIIARVTAEATTGGLTSIIPLTQWETLLLSNEENVTSIHIQGKGGAEYNVRVRFLSNIKPNSAYAEINHTLIGKTEPPPYVTGFNVFVSDPANINASWDAVSVIDLSYYEIRKGGTSWETAAFVATVQNQTSKDIPLENLSGSITYRIKAFDTTGNESLTDNADTLVVVNPVSTSVSVDSATKLAVQLSWSAAIGSFAISHYEVRKGPSFATSVLLGNTNSTFFTVTEDIADGDIYYIDAIDLAGNKTTTVGSAIIDIAALSPPTGLDATSGTSDLTILNDGTVIERMRAFWDEPTDPDWDGIEIEYKLLSASEWEPVRTIRERTTTEVHITGVGGEQYMVRARHLSQTKLDSGFTTKVHTLIGKSQPPANVTLFSSTFVGEEIELTWSDIADADRFAFDVRIGSGVFDTLPQLSDGLIQGTKARHKPLSSGLQTYQIKAVDTSGNYSISSTTTTITVVKQGAVSITSEVIDNFVLLKWSKAAGGSFPVVEYEVKRGDTFSTAELIGTLTGRFSSIFELQAGTYKYWVNAVDSSGIAGTETSISVSVSQPPDFVLYTQGVDDFSGTKTNAIVEDEKLLLPVNATETWEDHFVNNGWTTIQDQINAGYDIYALPSVATGQYQYEVDLGAAIASSQITFSVDTTIISGNTSLNYTIGVRETTLDPWTNYSGLQAFATNFRYIRFTVDASSTGGDDLTQINAITHRIDSKLKTDAGNGTANAGDSGGTVVSFNVPFIDVQSINVTPKATTPVTAVYDFVDVPYPIEFSVYFFNDSGSRISCDFSWDARGF